VFATQALNDLRAIGAAEALWESTALKLISRQDVPDAAEWIAKSIGTETVKRPTVQYERKLLLRIPSGLESEREVEQWTVHPNEIRRLTTGQAIAVLRWPTTETSTVNLNAYL
jgi:conjugal transfer pilus assembly protein TraD